MYQLRLGVVGEFALSFSNTRTKDLLYLNPFVPNVPFLYPLKTSNNFTVFWCFQGVEKGCNGNKWVNKQITFFCRFCHLANLLHTRKEGRGSKRVLNFVQETLSRLFSGVIREISNDDLVSTSFFVQSIHCSMDNKSRIFLERKLTT